MIGVSALKQGVVRVFKSTVGWSFFATFLRSGAAVFILPLILRRVPTEELGIWYVFLSMSGLISLLDLGISPTASRSAGYLWAGAKSLKAFGVERVDGESATRGPNLPELADLLSTLRVFYKGMAAVALALLLTGGSFWVWHKTNGIISASTVRAAWIVWCFGCFLNLVSDFWPAILVGLDQVRRSEQFFTAGLLLYYVIASIGLLLGWGLWSLVIATPAMYLFVRMLGRGEVICRIRAAGGSERGRFRSDLMRILWPNAWRMAAVSVGAYLIINANTLICGTYLDLGTTASYGLTFQVAWMLVTVSRTWVQVKLPLFAQWRSQGRESEIAEVFASRLRLSLLTFVAGAIGVCLFGPWALRLIQSKTSLIPLAPLICYVVILLLEVNHASYAALVMTENRIPFLWPALLSGTSIALLSVLLTPRLGIWGLILSQGFVQACYNNWWTVVRGIQGIGWSVRDFHRLLLFGVKPAQQP